MKFSWRFLFSSLTIALLLTLTVAKDGPVSHFCIDNGGNFIRNSTYKANLDRLTSSISFNTANDYGFYNLSSGQGSDRVNAIALCRGDVDSSDCINCINDATTELSNLCPNQKEAIIWYNYCMFRYATRSIFGVAENNPFFDVGNPNYATDGEAFAKALGSLLDGLKNNASLGTSLHKFATGEKKVAKTIYALVQCTPDLTEFNCSSCLSQAFGYIQERFERKEGIRLFYPNCIVRFEVFRFYQTTTAIMSPPASPISPSPSNDTTTPPPTPTSPISPPASNDTTTRPPTPASPISPHPSNDTPTTIGKRSNSSRATIIITVSTVAFAMLLISCCVFILLRMRKLTVEIEKHEAPQAVDTIKSAESLRYDFNTISAATNHFSDENKLGQGGFGVVYKGTLASGELIAVKRLSMNSTQGDLEFKNEVQLVAKLQHRNLVRLLGFCLERNERLLIYEFMPNASLDKFLFDPVKRSSLDWEIRHKIIGGIARGLLYLHQDSRLRIIHRDLKASNILLDAEMNPKIADFGLARLFAIDQTQGESSRIAGTYGYMAPECARYGQFSIKSDVFSFGVLLLEILSGRKNGVSRNGSDVEHLLTLAWRNWRPETALDLVDHSLRDNSRIELMRCIHIGLLCVQDNVARRPNMASVVLMLNSSSITLQQPSQPAFFIDSNTQSTMMSWSQNLNSRNTQSSQSRNEIAVTSKNEVLITELYPR